MSRGVINPVSYRPLFSRLRLVTCRTFETPAAGTIPLFGLERAYVRDIFGNDADALVLPEEHAEEKIADIMLDPEKKAESGLGTGRNSVYSHTNSDRLRRRLCSGPQCV